MTEHKGLPGGKWLAWIDLEKWIEDFSVHFSSRPRRYFWVFLTVSIFAAWGGFRDFLNTGVEASNLLGEVTLKPGEIKVSAFGLGRFAMALLFSWGFRKFLVSAILGFLICAADTGFTSKRIREMMHFTTEDNVNTLVLVLSQCGVSKAYRTERGLQTTKQHYASDVRAAAAVSQSLRMMSIAGYEYIGAGTDSLLYSLIDSRKEMTAEFILLDIEKGKSVIANRVERLKSRDPTITSEKIVSHINETIRLIRGLTSNRTGKLSIWTCACPTVFRLVILDNCLFVSAYKSNAHGHESPMFKIEKVDDKGYPSDWFDAFEQIYNLIKARSEQTV
jgi:hypothetical protein